MIKYFYRLIIDNKIPSLASIVAFNIILNGGAFLFLYLLISNVFNNSLLNQILEKFEDGELKELFMYFTDYQNNMKYSLFLIFTSIYSASSLYYHIINVIELLTGRRYDIRISKRIVSVVLTVVFLVIINVIAVLFFEIINRTLVSFKIGVSGLILILIGLSLYYFNYICVKTMRFNKIYKGYLFSFFYILLFTIGFIVYLDYFSNFKVIYGVLSFIFIFCFYIYSICVGVLIGLCMNIKNNLII